MSENQNESNGAIYVDLDGTLAYYDGWKGPEDIGDPIPMMMERVKGWIRGGGRVKIFTARLVEHQCYVREWLLRHGIGGLEVTRVKGIDGIEFWDDRAVAVASNTGRFIRSTEVLKANAALDQVELLADEPSTDELLQIYHKHENVAIGMTAVRDAVRRTAHGTHDIAELESLRQALDVSATDDLLIAVKALVRRSQYRKGRVKKLEAALAILNITLPEQEETSHE